MKRWVRWTSIASLTALLLALLEATAAPATASREGPKLAVVATFSILGDIVRNVGGDQVDLEVLVGPNQDTHEYEPTPRDATALQRADLIFENGWGFEWWLDRLYAASRSRAARIVVTDGLQPFSETSEAGTQETDPHAWGDVKNVMAMTMQIATALSQADAANADLYAGNASSYVARLTDLDGWIQGQVDRVPPDRRTLFSNHDSLGYLARRYGLTVAGDVMESFSTEAEPSAQHIAQLARDLRASGAKVLFIENVANPTMAQQVAREAGGTIAPELYTDALGSADSPAAGYIELMTYNVSTIVAALQS